LGRDQDVSNSIVVAFDDGLKIFYENIQGAIWQDGMDEGREIGSTLGLSFRSRHRAQNANRPTFQGVASPKASSHTHTGGICKIGIDVLHCRIGGNDERDAGAFRTQLMEAADLGTLATTTP